MEGYTSTKILIGTKATKLNKVEFDITHEWMVYVRAPQNIVKQVQYKLHESFPKNVVLTEYPFEHIERGWGEFTIHIKLFLHNGDKLTTSHFLMLHGQGDVVINESVDEIVYRGISAETIAVLEEEEDEYKRIDEGIEYMLKLLEECD